MASVKVSESELLAAVEASIAGPSEARTLNEIAAANDLTPLQTKRVLHILQSQGRLIAHRVRRPRMDGIMTVVSAYTILPTKKR